MSDISQDQTNPIWALRYRPSKVSELILPKRIKDQIENAVKGESSHLLLSGDPGLGKTTAAKAIANDMNASTMFINASLETGVDVIREKLTQFCSTVSAFSSSDRKVVILDEFEAGSSLFFQALRGFLEQFSKQALFIFTTNYANRIPDPIMSRVNHIVFDIQPDERADMIKQTFIRSTSILDLEGIEYDRTLVATVVKNNYPDMRAILTSLQRGSISGKLDSSSLISEKSNYAELVEVVKAKNWSGMRQWVASSAGVFGYSDFYEELSKQIDKKASLPEIVVLTSQYDYRSQFVMNKQITTTAYLTEVMGAL